MRSFPIALKLHGRPCLIVGSGQEALDRARTLSECGASVTVLAASPCEPLLEAATKESFQLERRDFQEGDLAQHWLAVLTERNSEVAELMQREAERHRVFFCAVDQPSFNSFAHMAIARASSLFVAIGTEGSVPALARRLRQELQTLFDRSDFANHVNKLAGLRASLLPSERASRLNEAVRKLRIEGRLRFDDPE